MNNKNILIRVDYSTRIGLGHIFRMLSFSESLKHSNYCPIFICKYYDASLKLIGNKGFRVEYIDQDCSIYEEIEILKYLVTKYKIVCVIFDIRNAYSYSSIEGSIQCINSIKDTNCFLISFEEFNLLPKNADVIVIPYVNAVKNVLEIIHDNSSYLLGPNYFILRNEFIEAGRHIVSKKVNTIFVSMGGSNVNGYTEKAIHTIVALKKSYHIIVIITKIAPFDHESIAALKLTYSGEIEIIMDCDNIASQMARSDIAIINSGLTKYETLALGLPTVVISNSYEHSLIMDEFVKTTDSLIHLGYKNCVWEGRLTKCILDLDKDSLLRKRLSLVGQKLIDGQGAKRLIKIINENV